MKSFYFWSWLIQLQAELQAFVERVIVMNELQAIVFNVENSHSGRFLDFLTAIKCQF